MDSAPAIEFRALSKDYGPVRALNTVNLSVRRGEIFGFLGPNGAGKTTAIRCLIDLIRPSDGRALLCGFDSRVQSMEVRRRCGYLPGELRLYDNLTGAQTIALFASLRASLDDAYLNRLLDRLDLDPTKQGASYSKGNKQKLGLVLAMMHQPDVLVLDEPTSGLDPLVQEEVEGLLREQVAAGKTVFFSSHVLSEVEALCDRVGFIRAARMVAVEEVSALKGRSLHIVEVTFAAPVPAGAFDVPGVREVKRQGLVVHLEVRNNIDGALKAIARFPVVDLRTEQPSLEQVFLAYYHEQNVGEERVRAAV
jgi:ABC-2 type transport system ATP-binding protein